MTRGSTIIKRRNLMEEKTIVEPSLALKKSSGEYEIGDWVEVANNHVEETARLIKRVKENYLTPLKNFRVEALNQGYVPVAGQMWFIISDLHSLKDANGVKSWIEKLMQFAKDHPEWLKQLTDI